ncbi:hypothetical protein H072_1467 [Dactylellina haptotyla CBS 200.50]|uniref:Pre-mRNA-processing factor 19 n=1 Tax=Dactylellina haptotyla (strain CBS 200.50) TaxID=1284197 RepID=S8ANW0_DACHA|nr:hypothetical protein H072_1467 [Dactylellina haptotyla CBS 200.50]
MLCAISGETPQVPTISSKSGHVYEKRLIEAYIQEHGKDPVTGEELKLEDLVDLKTDRTVRPRPPTVTSIPSLLSVFQNEWDALALETYTLRQQLAQTRQELSTALYQHDAAVRVIGRLIKERDEARSDLSKVMATGIASAPNGDEMQVDSNDVPADVVERINATHAELSAGRRKRPVPADWAVPDTIGSFTTLSSSDSLYPGGTSISLDASQTSALVGGVDGVSGVYSLEGSLTRVLPSQDGAITDAAWWGSRPITASASGIVRLWEESGNESIQFQRHAGKVSAVCAHPSGQLLGSVGVDKSYILYDLAASKAVSQVYTESALTSAHFHPDGHLLGAGTQDATVEVFDTRENKVLAKFEPLGGSVKSLKFSENGFWLAVACKGDNTVSLWDLRKGQMTKALEIGSVVESISWDYTGQYLATAGPQGITVQHYSKASKGWSVPLQSAMPAVALAWGARAESLVTLSGEGVVSVLGTSN